MYEILTLAVLVVIFWVARGKNKKRIALGLRRLREVQEISRRGDVERLKQLEAELENTVRESEEWTRLFGVTRDLGEVIRDEETIEVVRQAVETHLKLPAYTLFLVKDNAIVVRTQRGFDSTELAEAAFSVGASSRASWFMKQREPVLVDNLDADERFAGAVFPYRSLVALPMWVGDQPLGVLIAFDTRSRTFSRQDFTRVSILAKQLALGINKTTLYTRIEELSITDGLTKLYRHRFFMDRLEEELQRARRYSRSLSLLMGDLDFFKHFNDTYGHLEGDAMLQLTARVMEQHFKRPAILARYGGEEFAILLPDVTKESALDKAEWFRAALSTAVPASTEPRSPLTISIGVASFPSDAQTRRDMIARADLALYKAKGEGKNRVWAYDSSLEGALTR